MAKRLEAIHTLYQPIFEIQKGKILGYEALTRGRGRWRLPEDLFRRSYEQGFTVALDLECLWQAFRILPKLPKDKFLFVNIEPTTLGHAFRKGREGDLLLLRVVPYQHRIVFELTEGMKGRDFSLVRKAVDFLRKKGCRFAIDDVAGIGTKLLRLLSLKPAYMKIDISLIRGLRESHFQQELVSRIGELGKKGGCLLIAEGVERKRELDFVRRMGIPYAQGFYLAYPQKKLLKTA